MAGSDDLAPTTPAAQKVAASDESPWVGILTVLGLALAAGAYFVLRPGGLWAEEDTASMALAIRAFTDTGQLAPKLNWVYSNGYGYQAVSAAIMAFTGLRVETLQQVVYPLVSALVVLPAWALYRELTGSGRVAAIATLLLLLVPEHLLAMLRGSHERFDRIFMLTALWLVVRSVRFRGSPLATTIHVTLVLVATYGLIATNVLFGMSFIGALSVALVMSLVAGSLPTSVRAYAIQSRRVLLWMVPAGVVLIVFFLLFVYPPVGETLRALSTIPGILLEILEGGTRFNAYSGILGAWVSPLVFLALSLSNFLVLGISVILWLRTGWSWLRGTSPMSVGLWMLWVLFAAFAAQGAAGIVSDTTGALQGNVQYRVFSVFSTVAAPLLALALSRWRPRPALRAGAMAAVGVAAVLAMLKMSLDPLVSNKWLFYTAAEMQGLQWADARQRGTDTWVGSDSRLADAFTLVVGLPSAQNRWDAAEADPGTQAFLVSDVIRLQTAKLRTTLPALGSRNVVYDNGEVQLYRRPGLAAFDR